MQEIILASQSPRRKELLKQIGLEFEVKVADVDESISENTTPQEAVCDLAMRKACAVKEKGKICIGADTVVVCDGKILGKPANADDAKEMLKTLSGRSHYVFTGVAVCTDEGDFSGFEKTRVEFDPVSDEEIDAYIASKEPMDKAGAYGIQGLGAVFVRGIEGDYNNVVGLPINSLCKMLKACGVKIMEW